MPKIIPSANADCRLSQDHKPDTTCKILSCHQHRRAPLQTHLHILSQLHSEETRSTAITANTQAKENFIYTCHLQSTPHLDQFT